MTTHDGSLRVTGLKTKGSVVEAGFQSV
jgi:hypothetical protein